MSNQEHRLQEYRLASRILDSAMGFAIISVDLAGLVTSWNPGAEKLLGWSLDDMHGLSADRIFTPEDRAADTPAKEMTLARRQGQSVNERWHVRKDGTRFWGSGLMMPLLDESGNLDGYTKIMRDRTQERATELRYSALSAALPGLLFVTDANGQMTDTNESYRTFTGRGSDQLDGDTWLEALHDDDRVTATDLWRRTIASGEPFQAKYRIRSATGNYRCFDCRATPEWDDEGRIIGWMGTCLDVEDEARARVALERLNIALEHRVTQGSGDLASAIEELHVEMGQRIQAEDALRQAQKMEAIGQLTGGVAHDFNNLLTVILGSAQLLQKSGLAEDKRQRYLAAIVDTAQRASKLTSQLLAFARRQSLAPEVFDVSHRLEAMSALLEATLGSNIDYQLNLRCEPCQVLADPTQFDTAILNLAVNARDAMDGHGRVVITVRESGKVPPIRGHGARRGKFIEITVDDSGPGIPANQVDRVFEPFYTTKIVGKGTGLGLSQVHGFSKQSGGDIAVATAPEGGASFKLYLPSEIPGEHVDHTNTASAPSGLEAGQGCILIVEDNDLVGQFAAELLADLGFATQWVQDAASALDLLAQDADQFDVVFTDVVMPGMSGIELALQIRESHPRLPVILTSGYSHVLAEEGSHGFEILRKPYSAETLGTLFSRLLARPESKDQTES